ncbi:hypothetical protein HK100_004669, partial [Physocladia obscura]
MSVSIDFTRHKRHVSCHDKFGASYVTEMKKSLVASVSQDFKASNATLFSDSKSGDSFYGYRCLIRRESSIEIQSKAFLQVNSLNDKSEHSEIQEMSLPKLGFDATKTINKYKIDDPEDSNTANESPITPLPTSIGIGSPTAIVHNSKPSRIERFRKTVEMKMPIVVVSQDQFYGNTRFDPQVFNAWYRRDGFDPPIHGDNLVATLYTMTVDPQDSKVKMSGIPRNINYVKALGFPVIDRETLLC